MAGLETEFVVGGYVVRLVSYHGWAQGLVGPFPSQEEAVAWAKAFPEQARIGGVAVLRSPESVAPREVA